MVDATYLFADAAMDSELRRLRVLEAVFDPGTERQLLSTGAWPGRSCLEVGAGAGSIAAWMRDRVGPTGRVVAVDTDVRFLEPLRASVEVVQGDVRELDSDAESFDVIHVRYVLIHNQDVARILDTLLCALKPGGWLLVEEPDFGVAHAFAGPEPLTRAFEHVNAAIAAAFSSRGLNPAFGRCVPALLEARGLELVSVESDSAAERGGSPLAHMMSLSTAQLGAKYVASGHASADDVAGYQEFASRDSCWAIYYATIRALARKARSAD